MDAVLSDELGTSLRDALLCVSLVQGLVKIIVNRAYHVNCRGGNKQRDAPEEK